MTTTHLRVGQVMTRTLRTCGPRDSLDDAARIMWDEDCGCVPVVLRADDGTPRLAGMLTDRDVCMAAYFRDARCGTSPCRRPCRASEVLSCVPTDPVSVALAVMEQNQLHRLPVVERDAQLVGVLSLADCARIAERSGPEITTSDVGRIVVAVTRARDAGQVPVPV